MIKNGLVKRFAEIGKIKIGGVGEIRKSKENKDYRLPIRFEHFVVTTTEKGNDGNFIINHSIMKKLGQEPKEISIRLPFDSIDLNFLTSFQYYHGKKCICRGDGETAIRINQEGKENKINCNPDTCEFLKSEKCKVSGILSCHLPISMEVGGIYRFRTHSWNSVSAILSALEYFSENTNGVLQNLPLKLKFLKKSTQEHGNVNIVTLILDGIELMKMRELAFIEYENRIKLGIDMKTIEDKAKEIGLLDDKDDPADVEDEFYPPKTVDNIDPEPGISADDVKKKLEAVTPDKITNEVQGDLL